MNSCMVIAQLIQQKNDQEDRNRPQAMNMIVGRHAVKGQQK